MLLVDSSRKRLTTSRVREYTSVMSDYQLVQERLARTPLKGLRMIREKTGVPVSTLYKIKNGETKNPRINTIEAVAKYCRENP